MTVAAADVVRGQDDLLSIAVRHGYGSTEAFGRAFRAVHGAGPGRLQHRDLRAVATRRTDVTDSAGIQDSIKEGIFGRSSRPLRVGPTEALLNLICCW